MKKTHLLLSTILSSLAISLLAGCARNGFTIKWVDYDQTVLEVDKNVQSGTMPTYDGAVPTRNETEECTYVFTGWDPEVQPVTSNVTYVAQYDEIQKSFTVTWCNYDGTVLEVDKNVKKNTMPEFNGANPTRESTAQYTYSFKGWDKDLTPVVADVTYTAVFSNTVNKYIVRWMNGDVELAHEELNYGVIPEYKGETPEKDPTQTKSYEFVGWSPEVAPVTENATYVAQFQETVRKYRIKIYDERGNVFYNKQLEYGESVDDAPTDTFKTYYNVLGFKTKVGEDWSEEIITSIPDVTQDASYKIVLSLNNHYLINDFSNEGDLVSNAWDGPKGGKWDVQESIDVPIGSSLTNKTVSQHFTTTANLYTSLKIGNDFFYALEDFNDADYLQINVKFPIYPSGSKFNNNYILFSEGSAFSGTGLLEDNTGATVGMNGKVYSPKQPVSNGGWQQFKIYVSEFKAVLATVPSSNNHKFDYLDFSFKEGENGKELWFYDVEFHRVDTSKDFIINDCTNLSQIRTVTNNGLAGVNNATLSQYDLTESTALKIESNNKAFVNVGFKIPAFAQHLNDDTYADNDTLEIWVYSYIQTVLTHVYVASNNISSSASFTPNTPISEGWNKISLLLSNFKGKYDSNRDYVYFRFADSHIISTETYTFYYAGLVYNDVSEETTTVLHNMTYGIGDTIRAYDDYTGEKGWTTKIILPWSSFPVTFDVGITKTASIGVPDSSLGALKTGNTALNFVNETGNYVGAAFDISLLVDNFEEFDDTDQVVVYYWGVLYGSRIGLSSCNEVNVNAVQGYNSSGYYIQIGEGAHRSWNKISFTIGELKAITAIAKAHCDSYYSASEICKSNWLVSLFELWSQNEAHLIYSIELHHSA